MEFSQRVSGLQGISQSDSRVWGQSHFGEQRPLGHSRKISAGAEPRLATRL